VQRPAQIVDYRSIGATPVLLATGLALGAVIALALTLIASVRRRRRDLAIMKPRLHETNARRRVAWQATVDALVGAVVGIPLGILFGRELWSLFARDINAVPNPACPPRPRLVGFGTVVVAIIAPRGPVEAPPPLRRTRAAFGVAIRRAARSRPRCAPPPFRGRTPRRSPTRPRPDRARAATPWESSQRARHKSRARTPATANDHRRCRVGCR